MLVHFLANTCPNASSTFDLSDWVSCGISIATLLLNILFYIIIAPKISFRFQKKEDFLKHSVEFLGYLSQVNSFTNFDGVPTQVKAYCVTIDLLFKKGTAPEPLRKCMEDVFQLVKARKNMTAEKEIWKWDEDFRKKTHDLRVHFAKYTGTF